MLRAYLKFWMMYAIRYQDERSYKIKRHEAYSHWENIEPLTPEIFSSLENQINQELSQFFKTMNIPGMYAERH